MIRVLIVDDMQTIRLLLRIILEIDPELTVVGEAGSGEEALALCRKLRPDIVTMDINMPGIGGYEAIRQIMNETPCPIVVITGVESKYLMEVSFKALERGALTVLPTPRGISPDNVEVKNLINQIKTMAAVKVVKRSLPAESMSTILDSGSGQRVPPTKDNALFKLDKAAQLVAIGLSAGGPPALQTVLSGLPSSFPLPIVVVQHISHGFVFSLATWLSNTTPFRCKVAEHGETIQPGTVYLAPDETHLTIQGNGKLWLEVSQPVGGHRPSATVLFESVARNFGRKAIGIMLTGMGQDGAQGLKAMYQAGAYTIAQDEASSAIFGMPKAAIELNAVKEVLGLNQIAHRLRSLTEKIPQPKETLTDGREE
jgi:two-component system chemotaxis response regulator CheB